MAHDDDTLHERSSRLFHRLYEVAFSKAEELLKSREPKDWNEKESGEHYWSMLPILATDMCRYLLGEANMLDSQKEIDIDHHYDSMELMFAAVVKMRFAERK